MNKPLYASYRESFSRDIYAAVGPVIAAPVVVALIEQATDLSVLPAAQPPQNAIIRVNENLYAVTPSGAPICELRTVLAYCTRTVPVIYLTTAAAIRPLRDFFLRERMMDYILCASFNDREILGEAYEEMPASRCIMDCRGSLSGCDVRLLPGELVRCGAVGAIFNAGELTRENIHLMQQRFIHVYADARQSDTFDVITLGVNGFISADLPAAYAALSAFPEYSFTRRRNLYAHKGFQNNGKYTENSITGVRAAGAHGFDGAEIDVKLTSDLVPVVMHNLNTKGLFDCEEMVTEEVPYAALAPLRRIGFPEEGIDLFEDLMNSMNEYPDTPVVIEFKPNAKYHRVEEMVCQAKEILAGEQAQKGCLGIMGLLDPGLAYVHKILPTLPLGHCEGGRSVPPAPMDRSEAEDRLYRLYPYCAGSASGYNPEDVNINRLFNEYAKVRGINVFVWSRSWTLSPSKWEEHGVDNDRTYMAGYDGWTTDHGDMYLDLPVEINVPADFPKSVRIDGTYPCDGLMRSGETKTFDAQLFFIDKPESGKTARAMLTHRCDLHFGDYYHIFSRPFAVAVE